MDKSINPMAKGDRLIELLIKGLLYESCVEHCQARATDTAETINLSDPQSLLNHNRLSETDVSLVSWLHSLPIESFAIPFEQKALALNIERFQKPILDGVWSEQVLSTPFKPQTIFPFNATMSRRARFTELLTQSLANSTVAVDSTRNDRDRDDIRLIDDVHLNEQIKIRKPSPIIVEKQTDGKPPRSSSVSPKRVTWGGTYVATADVRLIHSFGID